MSHTPGPWSEAEDGWIYGPGGYDVVEYERCGSHAAHWGNPDDYRLALAAPELLALCQEMKDWLTPEVVKEPDRTFFWKLVAVIKKATLSTEQRLPQS